MACGKPVIATGYSGNMDFMTPDNSFLLRFKMVEIEKDHYMYKKGNFWADPDADHAVELMLRVAEDRKLAAEVARRGQSDVMSMLHPSTVAKAVKQRLALIEKVLPGHGHRGMNE
jgi:glycosyltransferase involved in cell wall biosynthesis